MHPITYTRDSPLAATELAGLGGLERSHCSKRIDRGDEMPRTLRVIALLAVVWTCSSGVAFAGVLDEPIAFSQPAQPLGEALRAVARQANIQILFGAALVAGKDAPALVSTQSPRAALAALLKDTNLESFEQSPGVIVIRQRTAKPHNPSSAPRPIEPPPPAPTSGDNAIGEIVVTAQRREQTSSDVPVSITAYDRASLDKIGARDVEDITRTMPGIIVRPGFEGITTISIRGVSSVVGSATTGIYIDDTPIQVRALGAGGVATSAFPLIFDLDRVEVLRGPQGTLFGSGSEGGTIRFITPTPSLEQTSVYTRSEFAYTDHGDPSYELGAAVGAPIVTDLLGFRASVYGRNNGGWVDREPYPGDVITGRNVNADDAVVANLAFTFKPLESLTITPSVYFQRQHAQDSAQYWPQLSDPSSQRFVSGQLFAQPSTEQLTLPSLKLAWDIDWATLYSNTSYIDHKRDVTGDYSFIDTEVLSGNYTNPRVPSPAAFENPQEAFTQEIRLQSKDTADTRLGWLVGAFYQDARQEASQLVYAPGLAQVTQALFGLTVPQAFGVGLYQGNIAYAGIDSSRDTQFALFGDASLHILPTLVADLGVRVARTQFNFTNVQNGPFNGGTTGGAGGASETPFSPKVGINYKPSSDLLVYASAAKGFRTGGANTPVSATVCAADLAALGLTHAPQTYDSDNTWSYELGSKLKTNDSRLLIDGSVFYVDWRNIQSLVPLLHCGFQYVGNLGSAVSKGFDLQTSAEVTDGLVLRLGLGYTDAEYSHSLYVAPGVPLVTQGDKLDTPPWHVSLASDYTWTVPNLPPGYLHLQYDYDSSYDLQHSNDATYDAMANHTPETRLMSARIGIRPASWDISLFADNVLNSDDRTSMFHDVPTSALIRYTSFRPRTIGITVSYRH
jgi:iron complex outermembrane recepter protein